MDRDTENLVWIDLEMTGLDPDVNRIIEIATVVTDKHLEVLAEGPVIAIHQPDDHLAEMDEWNTRQHGKSGLVERVRKSGVDVLEAESLTLEFVSEYVPPDSTPLCGNSICQDRRFLVRHMPRLEEFFTYRNLDVSTLKELGYRWAPEMMQGVNKRSMHLALDDIYDSINELRYYREHFIKVETPA